MRNLRALVPSHLMRVYHFLLALGGALVYRFPSRHLVVIAVTGTKGKTTVTELVAAILERAGHSVAVSNTVRFAIAGRSRENRFKMTMPGRFFLQKFLRDAVSAGCRYAVIEMTSEGARQFRHRFIALDALVFTNLAPEHIESHGSFDAYRAAKLSLAHALALSPKGQRMMIANIDDPAHHLFFAAAKGCVHIGYSLSHGETFSLPPTIPGVFNRYNAAAAATTATAFSVSDIVIRSTLENFRGVPGRMEYIRVGQPFDVIVDYAHTIESLRGVYEACAGNRLICILGSTGGGRDRAKRPGMGKIAEAHCARIILTNEDPYDEPIERIVEDIARGIVGSHEKIPDRRRAIRAALTEAKAGDTVIITGKGTDPYIMGPRGSKEPWSDTRVVREELGELGYSENV